MSRVYDNRAEAQAETHDQERYHEATLHAFYSATRDLAAMGYTFDALTGLVAKELNQESQPELPPGFDPFTQDAA